jgi:hypothetical protein
LLQEIQKNVIQKPAWAPPLNLLYE